MKKKIFHAIFLSILVIVLVMPLSAQKPRKKKVTFFAPQSFYVYVQGALINVNPGHYLDDPKESAFAPLFGAGFRAIRFSDRMFLNLEFDYSQANYGPGFEPGDRRVRFYCYKLGAEYRLSGKKDSSLWAAVGLANISFPDLSYYSYGDDSELTLLLEVGLKLALYKRFSLRADFRFLTENVDSYYDEYYDEWINESDPRTIATALTVGVQFNF
ncbi:MAG: porin family protein [bacterium]|nr:porin family protein [bacterium]